MTNSNSNQPQKLTAKQRNRLARQNMQREAMQLERETDDRRAAERVTFINGTVTVSEIGYAPVGWTPATGGK